MRGFTLIELLVVIAIIAILIACFAPGPLEVPLWLLIGWASYPFRIAGELAPDWPNLGIFAGSFAVLAIGLHLVGRWLSAGRWAWRRTAALLSMLLLAFVAGIALVSITHQSVWLAREREPWFAYARWGTVSRNNLKQNALACHAYQDTKKCLPLGGTFDAHGRGMHGWQTQLLPFVEETPLFNQIDLAKAWDDDVNLPAMRKRIFVYLNPSVSEPANDGPAPSHYAANAHVIGMRPMTLKNIADGDGTSNTLLVGEVATNFRPWGQPGNWRDPMLGLNKSPHGFGQSGGRIVNFAFADGSVRAIRSDVSPQFLRAISTPAGGEVVVWED